MSYIPLRVVEDMTNPSDRMGILSVQGLINALALYATTATTYTKTEVDALIAAKQTVLGYVAENVVNKSTLVTLGTSDTLYPSQNAVKIYVDTQSALKENLSNKSTAASLGTSDTLYPSQNAVKSYVDALGVLKENTANKSTSVTLGTSDVLFPTQNAVKSYVDTQSALKENVANKSTSTTLASASNTTYPSTLAAKTYIDTQDALKENLTNKSTDGTFASPSNTSYPTTQAIVTYFTANASKTGNNVQSGNGTTTSFNIPHTLGVNPSYFNVVAISQAAGNIAYITSNSTNITVYYSVAPITGTNNLSWNWIAKP